MTPFIRPTELSFDVEKLQGALNVVLDEYWFHREAWQISLVHSPMAKTSEEKLYDGVGSLFDREKKVWVRQRTDFRIFNEEFRNTYFHEVYQAVSAWSKLPLGRMRLMLRPAGSCYSMHRDDDLRYHLAITTNPGCYFFYQSGEIYQIPADGKLHIFDARHPHTGFNAGATDRVHLVFDTLEDA